MKAIIAAGGTGGHINPGIAIANMLKEKGFDELIETLASSYSHVGLDETIVITRSNKRANIYNQGIRNTVLDREDELCRGDQLMIVKNNYFWTEGSKDIPFIANGDIAVVQRVRNVHELYGFRFAEADIRTNKPIHRF